MSHVRILSLDGGGTRGAFYFYFLNLLEKRLKMPVRDMFDYIGGTSIGGISSLLLTHPLKWFGYRDDFYIQEMMDTHLEQTLLKVFFEPPPFWIKSFGIFSAKYSYQKDVINAGLKDHLFGSDPFGTNKKAKCLVFAHNASTNEVKAFKSWKHTDYYLYTVARATSAAPTYFAPVCIGDDVFIDGAMASANNPTAFMLYEASLYEPKKKAFVLSLGAGYSNVNFTCDDIGHGSMSEWSTRFVNLMLSASDRSFEYLSGRHKNYKRSHQMEESWLENRSAYFGRYQHGSLTTFRIKPNVSSAIDTLDPKLFEKLKDTAQRVFDEKPDLIDALEEGLRNY
ncbi:MAG: patatin-like phospholipase family protein [Alphaproteobacteria bacterium]|nr:MAG: patatin-like phospholipase family protein [Alphaproteobacteria bacterium]